MSKQIVKLISASKTASMTSRMTSHMARRITGVLVTLSLAVLLGACSNHNNPLNTEPTAISAKFLLNASQYAEKELSVFDAPGGYYYGECMTGKAKPTLCSKLYSNMRQYANTTVAFKGLSVADLTDKNTFKKLYAAYKQKQFDAV